MMVGRRRAGWWWLPAALATLAAAIIMGASIGPAGAISGANWHIIWLVRLPRVALAGIVGAMLSLAGASYQGVFRNPLVDPYLLGVAGGAGLGATLVLAFGRATTSGWLIDPLPLAAFVGALLAVAVTYTVGSAFGPQRGSTATLVLAGVAVAALVSAVQAYVLQGSSDGVVRRVYNWILGSLADTTWADVRLVLPYVVVSSGVLLAHRRHLDLLRVGDDEAASLGADVRRVRVVVVVSGLIAFVGIVVPHSVRLIVGGSYRHVLPMSVVVGAAFLILADIPARQWVDGVETPVGVVTAFLGAPFFIALLRLKRVQS
jgi:iron complex transport system permease protein